MIRKYYQIIEETNLSEAEEVMTGIMSGKAAEVQMSAYLAALALKGEAIDRLPLPQQA